MPPRPTGSLRERRSGVWEIRIAVATDLVTGRTVQRSFTFRGDRTAAQIWCHELAEEYACRRAAHREAPFLTVGELLARWIDAEHDWKPSTVSGYRSNVRGLGRDELLHAHRVVSVSPAVVRQAMARWAAAGAGPAVVGGRFRTLRSAVGWAYEEGIIDRHPLAAMRGPARGEPRRHLPADAVRLLLRTAEERLEKALADHDGRVRSSQRVHAAERCLLAVRLAADSGARRGELAALQLDDLDGQVLTIARGASMDQIGTTKTRRLNRLTLGRTTAALWHDLARTWRARLPEGSSFGPWLFSPQPDHAVRLTTGAVGHRFSRLRDTAGVETATLHRLRHSVATHLVSNGQILKAQARLGHREASTTLRNYAHAIPLDDADVADSIEALLREDEKLD